MEDNKIEITKMGTQKPNQEKDLDTEQLQQKILKPLCGIYKVS